MAVVTDGRSVTLQQVLVAQWKNEIKKKSPAQREAWLRSTEAIVALGATRCNELRKRISDDFGTVSKLVCSGSWLEAWWTKSEKIVPIAGDKDRRHGVRLMLSRGLVRIGEEGLPHRRWTPPNAVDVEDTLDCMGNNEARHHDYPASPSAMAIQRMQFYTEAALRRMSRK